MPAPLIFSWNDLILLSPEIFMTLLLCVVLLFDFVFPKWNKTVLAWISVAGIAVTIGILLWLYSTGTTGTLFKGMFSQDRYAIFFKIIILVSTTFVFLISLDYLRKVEYFKGEYYFLLLLSALGMMLMASANDFLSLFITLEFATFGFYILVAYLRENLRSNEAGLKFFILGVFTASILAYGISLIFGETGTILFPEIAQMNPAMTPGLVLGFLLIFVALAFKIGAVPFHNWVPDIYEGAPTPITAFLSIAPKAAAIAVLLRVFFSTFSEFKPEWVYLIVLVSIVSMTYGNIVAISQKNIKRLLAYSGIAQIGNILIGVAAGTKMGGDSILFYLLTYLFANIGAFAVVVAFSNVTNSDTIADYSGLNRRSPLLALALFIFLLSLAGVPPLAGFIGKIYLFAAAMKEQLFTLVIVGLINIVISMYYYLVVVKKIYIGEPTDSSPIYVPSSIKAVIYVSLAGVLILGVYPRPFINIVVESAGIFSHLIGQ
ncbi:MAG TPA: NADH-quinone oxidoreductase subunit N [Nitrospiria bacterium]|jgi:NADH-quinone oxidoreductase subunit N